MSIVITKDVFCDGVPAGGGCCPEWVHGATAGGKGPSHAAARRGATFARWRSVSRGVRPALDYCPTCWARRGEAAT